MRIAFSNLEAEITLSRRLPIDRHLYRLADRTEFPLHSMTGQTISVNGGWYMA
jgi:hypothetical protein